MGKFKNRRINPALDIPYAAASLCTTTEDISANEIVYVSGRSGAQRQVTLARANALLAGKGTLLIAKHDTPSGERGIFLPWRNVTGVDTSGQAVGDKVFLSGATAGGYVFAVDTGTIVRREIGTVISVDASDGQIDFNMDHDPGEEIGGTGVPQGVNVHILTVPAAGGSDSIVIRDALDIIDAYLIVTTGNAASENLLLTNAGNTVCTIATGTSSSADDLVRATALDKTYESIAAGASLAADLSGTNVACVVYVLTRPTV